MKPIIIEQFNGNPVSFQSADAFVNATLMCAPFEKFPNEFLRLASTESFIEALRDEMRGNPAFEPVVTLRGQNGGTWLHPDLALECARWLSPKFAIWCNRVIRIILAGGGVTAPLTSVDEARIDRMLSQIEAVFADRRAGVIDNGGAMVLANLACQYLRAWDVKLRIRAPKALEVAA